LAFMGAYLSALLTARSTAHPECAQLRE